MRRIILALVMTLVMAAMTAAYALPGFAQITKEPEEETEGPAECSIPMDSDPNDWRVYDEETGEWVVMCPVETEPWPVDQQAAAASD